MPRREQERFEKVPPSIKEWQDLPSLKACLEQRRTSGRPIDFVYDDQCNHLASMLISQRESHLTVGYVTSSAEEHFNHAQYLSKFCDRVLVEKPVSRVFSEIQQNGRFPRLAQDLGEQRDRKCYLRTAEHYLFRPGVTAARQSGELENFLRRHQECNLHYEFCFEEPAGRDDPTKRLAAYQDGSILDILAPHGLGPMACLLLPMLRTEEKEQEAIDFAAALRWRQVRSWQATESPKKALKIPVLSETAAELCGSLSLPGTDQTIHLTLRSAKGCQAYLRFFRLSCAVDSCRHVDLPVAKRIPVNCLPRLEPQAFAL